MAEHDQRFKNLLQEFTPEFVGLFCPRQGARFDFSKLRWEDKEILTDPPHGEVYRLDLVARVPLLAKPETTQLLHVEIESRDAVATFRPRVYNYYYYLSRKRRCRVLTLAVYMRVGLEGVGIDTCTEVDEDGLEVVRFQYRYVGLPALDAARYVAGDNWLGVALSALMDIPRERKGWLRAEALRRILLECKETQYRKSLLLECVEAYLELDEDQQGEYQRLLLTNPYQEVGPMMQTTYERGIADGERKAVRSLLQDRFGPLPEIAQERLKDWPAEKLNELLLAVPKAPSLQALGLAG